MTGSVADGSSAWFLGLAGIGRGLRLGVPRLASTRATVCHDGLTESAWNRSPGGLLVGWVAVGRAVHRPPLSVLAAEHMSDPEFGQGLRAAVGRCQVALDGDRVGQIPAHFTPVRTRPR